MKERGNYTSEHALWGRIGGYTKASRIDGYEGTKAARNTFLKRFETQVDPDGSLPESERLRRAEAARKAYMLELSRKSAQARRK